MLRRLLQSQADGAADGHLAAGMALFSAADMAAEVEKRLLYDQIFFCLMRSLEDFAMLCLMGWDESRHPLDIYLNLDRPELRAFFARARKGLGDEVMYKLCGVAPWAVLKKLPAFKDKDFSSDEDALDWASRDAREALVRFGKLYHCLPEDADTVLGPWQAAYARAPIGLKLLVVPEGDETEILLGSEQADPGSKAVPTALSASVLVDSHFVEKVLHELEAVCRQLKRLARRRLAGLDDAAAFVSEARSDWQEHLKALASKKAQLPPSEAHAKQEAASPESEAAEPPDSLRSSLIKPLAYDIHEEPRHDVPEKKILEVGGIKIIHSESERKNEEDA
jgi:hypothetical protein